MRTLTRPVTALLALSALTAMPAAAASCPDVQLRLWQKNAETWYDHDDVVEIAPGEEGHLYIHVRSDSRNPYTTRAEISYPRSLGMGGASARDVGNHLRMSAQNEDDLRSGRLRFTAQQPGLTTLGFAIQGVKSPGDMSQLGNGCRRGTVEIRVLGGDNRGNSTTYDRRDDNRASNRDTNNRDYSDRDYDDRTDRRRDLRGANRSLSSAESLVNMLYSGMLRRERLQSDPDSFTNDVVIKGRDGLVRVAQTITESAEFRQQALTRSGSNDPARLLDSIYRDLYGGEIPQREKRLDDLDDLERCLRGGRDGQNACSVLGRNLVTHPMFYAANGRLLDDVGNRRR